MNNNMYLLLFYIRHFYYDQVKNANVIRLINSNELFFYNNKWDNLYKRYLIILNLM